ncbi:hypothetical protein SSX86_016086 [Deinandra increscens subsp. villosa]|uniref:Amino acid transporter transmembrane domain-containing protein n=1 Tax=Deinandra increscens subsp. villosa TaxID=3103831 RepID=A0AAP0D4L8_9ASTR
MSTFFTAVLIKRSMDIDPTIKTYPDIGHRAFGRPGRFIVLVTMNLELYLVATAFLILEGDNLSHLFPDIHFHLFGMHMDSKKSFVLIVTAIILPTTWLRNLRILSYISATGVMSSFIILGSIIWIGKFDGAGFEEKGQVVNWKGIPSALSLYVFCYGAHPLFPTLYTLMRRKRQFSKVLLFSFGLCTMIYASMGVVGYLMFGVKVNSQVTLNLPTSKTSSKVAIFTTLVSPIVKYALVVTPVVETIEEHFIPRKQRAFSLLLIRTTLVITTMIVALSLPFFEQLMSIIGALLNVTLSILLPSLCYLKISGAYKVFGLELVIIGLIVLLGIFIGTVSVVEMVRKASG